MSIEDQFNSAVKVIRSLPKNGAFQPSDELKLKFYAYFKQATEGPNTTKKPPFYDIVNRYKWDAWNKLSIMSRTEAMAQYVEEFKQVIDSISVNKDSPGFVEVLGPFYEYLSCEIAKDPVKNAHGNEILDDEVTKSSRDNFNTYDSEGDEFTDTFDGVSQQLGDVPLMLRNENACDNIKAVSKIPNSKEYNGRITAKKTRVEVFQSDNLHARFPNGIITNDQKSTLIDKNELNFNEQLTLAIFQLQKSVDGVVHRMDNLEKERSKPNRSINRSQWPFQELSSTTTACLIAWPIIAYFVIHYFKQLRKK